MRSFVVTQLQEVLEDIASSDLVFPLDVTLLRDSYATNY